MALRSGTPGLELALTLLAILGAQRLFAAYGGPLWTHLYDTAGPKWATMALVYVGTWFVPSAVFASAPGGFPR